MIKLTVIQLKIAAWLGFVLLISLWVSAETLQAKRTREDTFLVKTFEQGEKVVAMTSLDDVLVIATDKAIYATGNAAKIKNLFPEERQKDVGRTPEPTPVPTPPPTPTPQPTPTP